MNGSFGSENPLQLELENVQSVLQLTKENIDALNERFSKFKPPPKIYLEEYQVSEIYAEKKKIRTLFFY